MFTYCNTLPRKPRVILVTSGQLFIFVYDIEDRYSMTAGA